MKSIRKVLRFTRIYGLRKTLFKALGRLRSVRVRLKPKPGADVGVIGAGQFAFATIGYSIYKRFGNRFVACFDVDQRNARTFCDFYGLGNPSASAEVLIDRDDVKVVYIASNHASHACYARQALQSGKITYIEKPVCVDHEQFCWLVEASRGSQGRVFAGYNRPFSAAIRILRQHCSEIDGPMTLSCFVSGHQLGPDHWYRQPGEGTRICGNVGHWIDLAVHMLRWGRLVDRWAVTVAYSNWESRDDDLAITFTSERGDLINIVLTSRTEPFEGINETINFQQGHVIAKIDDFRAMTIWQDDLLIRKRFWPKDVGHDLAITQPFHSVTREWAEVELSTLMMLFVKDMVTGGERCRQFSFSDEWKRLGLPRAEAT